MPRSLLVALMELKRIVRDRGDMAFSLALPVALFALMYGAFGGDTGFHATAHVVDRDGGPAASALLSRLEGADGVSVEMHTPADAEGDLERSAVQTVVVILEGFSGKVTAGEPASLILKQRGNGGDEGQIVASIVRGLAQEIASEARVHRIVRAALADSTLSQGVVEGTVDRRLAQAKESPPVGVTNRVIGGEEEDPLHRLLPGVVVMFLLFAVTLGSQGIVEERRTGTLERLMTTRLSLNQLFTGKFLAGIARAFAQAVLLLALGFAVLRVGDAAMFIQVLVFSLLVAAAVSAIGLLIGAVARTRDQATWAAVFITMFMTVFGGTFFEVGDSGPLAVLSRFTLNRYALDALSGIVGGEGSLAQYGMHMGVMVGIAAAGLALARLLFHGGR